MTAVSRRDKLETKEIWRSVERYSMDMKKQDGITLIERIATPRNLVIACEKVYKNKGAAGIDGITVQEIDEHMGKYQKAIIAKLLDGTYKPQPVKRVSIPKENGSMRNLGIPVVRDRIVQQAILQIIEPLVDPYFSKYSFGFRKGRSAHDAIKQAEKYIEEGYKTIVDCDLKNYFDMVNHQKLMVYLREFIQDEIVLKLIWSFLRSGIMEENTFIQSYKGTPQGGVISPLLANIYLNQLDRELEKRGHRFVRYADDFCIYVKTPRAGERVLTSVTTFLEKKLKLTVNTDKSKVTTPGSAKFLGFTIWKTMGKSEAVLIRRLNTNFAND